MAAESTTERSVPMPRLYAEFEVTPSESVDCPLDALDGDFAGITRQFVGDDHLILESYLPDREQLSDLIDALRAVTARISLRRLSRIQETDDERSPTALEGTI